MNHHQTDLQLEVPSEAAGQRLDIFLTEKLKTVSRSAIQRAIRSGQVTLNERKPKSPHEALRSGDLLLIDRKILEIKESPATPQPQPDIKIKVIHEDPDLLVIEKPSGLLVHSTVMNEPKTLVGALLASYPEITKVGDSPERPGIVHRLDRDASGLLIVARNNKSFLCLKQTFKEHTVKKEYLVLIVGNPPQESGTIDRPIGRSTSEKRMAAHSSPLSGDRLAITHYQVKEIFDKATLLTVQTETGRTHQIRVHLKSIGCPVVGDKLYGPKRPSLPADRLFLHATHLSFIHPITEQPMEFNSPLPEELENVLKQLRVSKK